ncbi:hypothetical protein CVT24_013011 [Panaeolus cyanescens]|uniref:Uncharacterized protein n=1 Tax=Panaeolus cyanescens TaxID=181874 RepID=A0A409VVM5_9AGAR|nr:hypothetical protein CVT24_013011 [Panaeolus cyanescens]
MRLPSFEPTEDEVRIASQILDLMNGQPGGSLDSSAAIEVFKRSGLDFLTLRDIWEVADENASGDLSRDELTKALRLIGWVQAGEVLHQSLLTKSGPIPTLDGITNRTMPPPARPVTPSPSPAPPLPTYSIQSPPLRLEDVRAFKQTFVEAGPVNGLLSSTSFSRVAHQAHNEQSIGAKVMDAFMASNLSYEDIRTVWKLVDISDRRIGLDFREFTFAMYYIQALQSCKIPAVPDTIPHELYDQFKQLDAVIQNTPAPSPRPPPSRPPPPPPPTTKPAFKRSPRPSSSSAASGPTSPSLASSSESLSASVSSLAVLPSPEELPVASDVWDISFYEKFEADKQFVKLDTENKGYIDGKTATEFMLSYNMSSADLARIWNLADVDEENRLDTDTFAVAMYLIQKKLAGEDIPVTLPPSLIPPSRRQHTSSLPSSKVPPLSPRSSFKAKPPPPPPPLIRRQSTDKKLLHRNSISSPITPHPTHSPSMSLSEPLSPTVRRIKTSNANLASASFLTSNQGSRAKIVNLQPMSPFDDDFVPSASRPISPAPPATTSPEDHAALEEFKKETARLTLQVESLLEQLKSQNSLRESNEYLRDENKSLKAQIRDMERTVSEVLSANEQNGSQEQYIMEIGRLTQELLTKEGQVESMEKTAAVLTQDADELRAALREANNAVADARNERDELRSTLQTRDEELKESRGRVEEMTRAMAEPGTSTNNREMRVLFKDVTRENEKLKGQVRDMQKSMERLLLSTQSHARHDELERENNRLRAHAQEMELLVTKLQSRSSQPDSRAQKSSETLARENTQLKQQLAHGSAAYAQLRSESQTKIVDLEGKIATLTREVNRLKIEAHSASSSREDNTLPPPSYDDAFAVP